MANSISYPEIISRGFPLVQCHCSGDDFVYSNLVWDAGSPIPSKQALDEWHDSNIINGLNTDKKITVLAFRNRFTKTEKIIIEFASLDNPTANVQQRQMAAAIRVDLKDTDTASFIDLNRADTRIGVLQLEQYGLIGTGRANEILDTPVQDVERPLHI